MEHFSYLSEEKRDTIFYKAPEGFNKYSDKDLLSYSLGATLYMPATRTSIAQDLLDRKFPGLSSMVIDLEDSVGDEELHKAEAQLLHHIDTLNQALERRAFSMDDLPLIFIRVRDPLQFRRISSELGNAQQVLTGYVFPKFSSQTGAQFLEILEAINQDFGVLYGMPILESSDILFKESRMDALMKIKALLDSYKRYILTVRIGATDFSGLFGIRRKVDTTIYDVGVIRDCMTDIINLFNRKGDGYVLSGPVWEFFSKDDRILRPKLRMTPFQQKYGRLGIEKRSELINEYIDGLMNEVLLDQLNGIVGKTIIHPTHIRPVHALYTVTHEDYTDAASILGNHDGKKGVLKSKYANKMNEMKPHAYWADRILARARAFGVYNEGYDFTSLVMENDTEFVSKG